MSKKINKTEPRTTLEVIKSIRSNMPRGRSAVMLSRKDKLQKIRSNAKRLWKMEVDKYV